MSKTLLSKAMTFLSLVLLVSALHAQANDATANTTVQQPATSKVRIVRLSMVKGSVEIERSRERGFERAIANLPVVERNQLQTGTGVAEVEFEDNSSLRLAPDTKVEFPELGRTASGATASSVHVIKGTVYVSLMKTQSKAPVNDFALVFGDRKLALDPGTHVRLGIEGTEAKLAVLDGSVHVDGAAGAMDVAKKKTATFDMTAGSEPKVANEVAKTDFDGWDHDASSYHSKVASLMGSNSAYGFGSPYAYGLSDMAYYGNFMNSGGCGMGMMWRPYFATAAWDPFANGTWAWYQGAGYSWVSPYPWAWTPYHYGSWGYCPSLGWGWMPGGSWYGVDNVAALTPATGKGITSGGGPRVPPPHAPMPHEPTMLAIGTKPLTPSTVTSLTSFEFRKDSAGLGVPRETLGNLGKFSRETESRGVATARIYVNVPESGRLGGASSTAIITASIHRGYAPSSPSSSSSSSWSPGSSFSNSSAGSSRSTSVAPSAPSAPASGGGVRK